MTEKKKGSKALSKIEPAAPEIVGKTPAPIADEQRRMVALQQEIEALLGGAYSDEEIAQRAAFFARTSSSAALTAGVAFVALKKQAGHGRYIELLANLDFCRRTASRYVAYARTVLGADLSNWGRESLAVLGPSKLRLLADFSDQELDALANDEEVQGLTLDKISRMSSAELQKALRKAEKKIEDVKAAHDADTTAANELKRENTRLRSGWSRMPIDERVQARMDAINTCAMDIESCIGDFDKGMEARFGLSGAIRELLTDASGDFERQAKERVASHLDHLKKLIETVRIEFAIEEIRL